MKNYYLILCCLLIAGPLSYAQKRVASITIEHIEIEETGRFSSKKSPDNESIQMLSLVSRNYRGWYSYWTFPNSSSYTSSLSDGTSVGIYRSSILDINTHLKGQEMSLELKNNSSFWLSVDLSSFFYGIYYYDSVRDYWAQYPIEEFQYTLGTLFNYDRGAYDVTVLPPGSSTTASFFRIDGYSKGYDIISNCIKDQSRFDYTIAIKLYQSNPFSQEASRMKKPSSSGYAQQAPKQHFLPYKGPFFKEGDAIHLYSGNEDYLLPEYKTFELKCVSIVKIGHKDIKTHINEFGLEVYGQ